MNEITVKTANGGTMRINFEYAFDAWGITNFKKFAALAKESDAKTGTNALLTAAESLLNKAINWFKSNLSELFSRNRKAYEAAKRCDFKELKTVAGMRKDATEIEKALKFLDVASAEKFAEFAERKKEIENEIEPNTAGTAENIAIAELMKRKARTTKKNAAYIANMNPNALDYKTPFVVYVGDRVEIPKTDKAAGYVAYIRYNGKTKKFAATEETSGILLTTGKTRAALINELSKCDFVERVGKALESEKVKKVVEEVARFKRGERAEIAEECKEASRDECGNVPPEVVTWFETVYPNKEDKNMKNVWYMNDNENENENAAEIETAPAPLPAGCMCVETRKAGTPYTPAPLPWYLRDDDPEAQTPALTFSEYCEAYPEAEEPAEPEAPAPAEAPAQPAQTTQPTKPADMIKYKADDLHRILHTDGEHVRYTGHTMRNFDGDGYYITYGARFVVGAMYRIPENFKKSRSADIIFRVDRNTGKSLTITVFEKYNGKITEAVYKNKKLNPGNKYEWLHIDKNGKNVNFYGIPEGEKDNYIDFTYWECIDIDKISRWTSGALSVIDAKPVTADDFARFNIVQAQAQPAAPAAQPAQPAQPSAPLDFTPKYYPVSEELARLHKHAISYSDYKPGTVTAEYKTNVDYVYKLCENSTDPEKSLFLADIFAKRLARWFDDWNRNGASCPSVLIAGPANFPVRRKEKQNARADVLMQQYNKIMNLRDKIKNPHGYRTEIEREEITNEFDSIIYFDVNINKDENRLQLIFPEKPEENVRAVLKSHGFRWSNRFGAWQRQLTENAVSAVWTVVNKLDDMENAAAESAAAEIAEQHSAADTAA